MRRHFLKTSDIAPPLPIPQHRVPRDIFGSDAPAPATPDYSQMAAASKEAAELGYKLGGEQLAEARRQYDLNREMAAPVAAAQKGLMDETLAQGRDYYEYGKEGRPVERALNAESMQDVTARDQAERDLITGGDTAVYNARRADIESGVDRATSDARQGITAEYNRLLRQGLRYGYSPQAIAARFGPSALQAGLGVASAANTARTSGIDRSRGLLGQGRNMRIQDDALRWGRRMDVAGLYRNMPGAAQGAYGIAMGAGNSAVGNTMAPGTALMGGMAQGAGIQQTGQGQRIQGLGSILNSQTSVYNSGLQAQNQGGGGMGALIGAAGQIGAAAMPYLMSDRRLKDDIKLVGMDARTGLNLYEFRYKGEEQRYRGVMADEVEQICPEAIVRSRDGFAYVDYGMLGVNMVEV